MSGKASQLCRFCQKEVKLAYYCEECGVSCCSDCLYDEKIDNYICQDCNSKNIDFYGQENKKVCKDCQSENINKITQHLKSCPKCHSHKILNIFEKKEELEQKFLELIKETRSFIKPLRDIINELFILRHKIKVARDPPVRCYHYPQMEKDLLTLFKQINYIKDNTLEKINNHFRHIALNKEYFFDIYNQPNSNIRIIESILDNLCRDHDSIDKFIQENVSEVYQKFKSFQKNLRFIDKINRLFLPYKRFLNLAEEEKPVYAIKTKLINGLDTQRKCKKSKGILFITNYDLSFVHEYGMVKKKQQLIFKAPVSDLINISDKGKLFKKLFIQFEYGKYEFSLPSNFISKVIDYIILARSFQEKDIYDEQSANELQNIDIDLNDLIRYIEEGINSFFNLKIKHNTRANEKETEEIEKGQRNQSTFPYYFDLPSNNQLPSSQNNKVPNIWDPKRFSSHPYLCYPDYYNFPSGNANTHYLNPPHPSFEYSNYLRNTLNPINPYDYDRNNFYPQNLHNPYRYQNYKPNETEDLNNFHPYYKPINYNNQYDFDDRNLLIKQLGKAQKYNPFSDFRNEAQYKYFQENPTSNPFPSLNPLFKQNSYQNFPQNRHSDFFDPNDPSLDNPNFNQGDIDSKTIYKKVSDFKIEKHSLKETLKELESKFENGIISEVDYFRTYKNLQKDIYTIEEKIRILKEKLSDTHWLKKNFNKTRYNL